MIIKSYTQVHNIIHTVRKLAIIKIVKQNAMIHFISLCSHSLVHTDGMWPEMQYVMNSEDDRRLYRLISSCATVSGVLCACNTCMDSRYDLGVCSAWACAWFQNLLPSLSEKVVRLSLSSGRLFSLSNEIYCVFF